MNRNLGKVIIFENPAALAEGLADLFLQEADTTITERGRFLVSLAGGTTPLAAYRLLAQSPRCDEIQWENVKVFFGDERCVPSNSFLSNFHAVNEALLSHVPIPQQNIYRMRGEIPPGEAAADYAQILRRECGEPPCFDLMMLGLGKDAHTASLFPGEDPLTDDEAFVRNTYSHETQTNRLTMTPRVINNARTIVIATEGSEKAAAFAAVRGHDYDPVKYPAQVISPANGRLLWYIDRDVASG